MKSSWISSLPPLVATPGRPPTHAEIATGAQALWQELGRPIGRDDHIWLAVERSIVALQERKIRADQFTSRAMDGALDSTGRGATVAPRRHGAYSETTHQRRETPV
jgi:hypothetical protein